MKKLSVKDISDCCGAEIDVVSGSEGTNYWCCRKCGNACNPSETNDPRHPSIIEQEHLDRMMGKEVKVSETNEVDHLKEFDYRMKNLIEDMKADQNKPWKMDFISQFVVTCTIIFFIISLLTLL